MGTKLLRRILTMDKGTMTFLDRYRHKKPMDQIMTFITTLGNLGWVWVAIGAILFLFDDYRIVAYGVFLSLLISTIVGEGIIKHIVRRSRPFFMENRKLIINMPITYSFPSGHAMSSFAAAGMLSFAFPQWLILFFLLAFLIGFSRIYLYVHYPSDVIAGMIIGLICTKLTLLWLPKLVPILHTIGLK